MKSTLGIVVVLFTIATSAGYAQSFDSAYAPFGSATGSTNLRGDVGFEDGKDGLQVINELRGLDAGKSYDLYVLSTGCPAVAPLDKAGIERLRQAVKSARKLATLKSGNIAQLAVKGSTVADIMSKGVVVMQADAPVECALVSPKTFGAPPAQPFK